MQEGHVATDARRKAVWAWFAACLVMALLCGLLPYCFGQERGGARLLWGIGGAVIWPGSLGFLAVFITLTLLGLRDAAGGALGWGIFAALVAAFWLGFFWLGLKATGKGSNPLRWGATVYLAGAGATLVFYLVAFIL